MSLVIKFNFAIELNRKNLFWNRFSKLIKEASAFRPYLVRPAEYYIEELEELFIEGKKLRSFEDLEIALDKLNYLKFSEFRLGKEKFLKFIEAERNVEEIRRVKFEF
jgi:hypothetical protein